MITTNKEVYMITPDNILLNHRIYGLTASTVQTFREAVQHGYSFAAAQRALASTYADNKALAYLSIEQRLQGVTERSGATNVVTSCQHIPMRGNDGGIYCDECGDELK